MTTEREAFEAWVSAPPFEYSIDKWPKNSECAWPGQYRDLHVQLAWEAWQAALTRQEAQQECPKCGGTGGERWHEADGSENGARCDACDGFGTQQEAQGAVAWMLSHPTLYGGRPFPSDIQLADVDTEDGWTERPLIYGDTTQPAPVDVRALRELVGRWRKLQVFRHSPAVAATFATCADELLALLDGQPAVVDDAMVERAHEEYVRVAGDGSYVPVDEVALRAALQAALGGGGGRG